MPSSILSPTSTFLPNTAAALGLLSSAVGTNALLSPRSGTEIFGLKPVADEQGNKLTDGLARVYGIRNVAMGITTIAVWWFGRGTAGPVRMAWRQMLGLMMVAGVATPIADGWVVKELTDKGEWNHWIFGPISLVLGGSLLGWFDRLGA